MEFLGKACHVVQGQYSNGRIALRIVSLSGEPLATATINMPEVGGMKPDYVIIKDYSENEGMLDWLVSNRVVTRPIEWVTGADRRKHPVCAVV